RGRRGLEAVETYALTVNSTQIPPSLGTGLLENAAEDQAYQAQLTATDPDIGEVLQFSLSGAPAGMSVDGQTGTVTWRPTQAQVGLHSVTAIVTDSAGLTDQRLTVITVAEVNDAPEITSTPPTAATQGSEYRYTVSASDPDPGDTLTFELGGAPGGATLDPASGLLTWTPGPDQTGPQTLSVRVRDAAGATDAQSVAVTVANVNDPPVFAGPPTDTEAVEGEPYTYQLSAEDPDGDTLTFSRSSGPSGLTVSADGVVAWTPGFDAAGGTHAVDVEVSDGNLQASLSFTLTVLDVNRAPTFGAVADQTVAEDQTLSLTLPVSEPDGEAMTFVVEEGPVLAVWNPTTRTYQSSPAVTVDAAGVLTYLASGRHVGTQTLRVRAEDPSGASDRVAFAVTVTPINDPPVFQTTPPTSALVNQVYSYAARATDEDSSGLAYRLVSGPASMTVDPVAGLVSWVPRAADLGSQDIVLEVSDTVATARQEFTVTVTDPGPSCAVDPTAAGCQALAWSYALARDGTPIGGAFVDQVGPTLAMRSSDLDSGRVGLGGGEGAYSWVLSASQYVSVSARATLARGDAQWIAFPRMAPLTDLGGPIPADAPVTFEDPDQRVDLILAAQGLGAPRQLAAAILDGQSLPGWLPEGWSLVRGVYFTSDTVLSPAATARMYLPAPLPSGTSSLVLAHWDETLLEWRMVASVPTAGVTTSVDVSLTQGMGGYALVLPDVSPAAPPTPTLNALLAPVAGSGSAELGQLEGRVEPAQQVASLDARDVTGRGLVARTHTAPLSSGAVVPAVLEESFRFSDGRSTLVPDAGLSVAFYQYPPNPEQVPATGMHSTYAAFEILPRQLYPVETLDLARQTVELRRTSEAAQVAVDNQGGAVADGAVSVSVPTGALSEVTLVELETLAAERFQSDGEPAVSAFRLAWTGGDALAALEASFGGTFEPGRCHVLARQLVDAAEGGWTPVERFTVSATGQLESAEATAAERLEGIRTGGTYAVFAGAQLCPDVVAGEVRDTLAAPVAGARVDVLDTRWATRTPLSGAYRLLQAPGASTDLHAQTPAGLEGRASTPNAGPQTGLQITVANPVFEVVQVEPAPSPTVSISPLSRFRVQFGQALSAEAQASSTGLTLRQGTTVLASTVQVASGGYALELTPNAPLPMGVTLTLEVEASLTSAQASTLQGTRSFGFLTHAPVLRSVGEPQLISYAPGQAVTPCHGFDTSNPPPGFDPGWEAYPVPGFDASNPRHTCVVGTTGVAEPASSVILVNEETGNTSTTLAAVNGSFRGVLEADERDLLSANLRNLNGTTLT
ncbi:MAG: putative Ig domain-containing protein, partial [Myxococcota bacterium]